MENHDKQLLDKEIYTALHKQQVLEYLKGNYQGADLSSNTYAQKILSKCGKVSTPFRSIAYIPLYFFAAFTLLFTMSSLLGLLGITIYTLLSESSIGNSTNTLSNLDIAQMEISTGNYESARAILIDMIEEDPNNGYILITYSELCQLEGRYDESATVLIHYLNNVSGIQNVQKDNGLYRKLKELTGPFSPDVENAYQECITECEESIENFNFLDVLLETQRYQMALRFCDSMKQEGATDYYLYHYYYTSYTQLGKYEECAAYFLGLADAWEEEGEVFSFRLPLKGSIEDNLEQLKPYVSGTTQEQIDAACSKLSTSLSQTASENTFPE